jgi:hypothetical protein
MIERSETSTSFHARRFILRRGVIAVFVWIVFAATTAQAQLVTYDYDRSAMFSHYRTYAWTRNTELTDANHERVVRAIDAALVKKGLAQVEATAGPDVLVTYHVSFEIEGYGLGAVGFAGKSWGAVGIQRILVETLVIDIADAQTGKTVWQSRFTCDIRSSATLESRSKTIAKATERMFKEYPPKPERPQRLAGNTEPW